VVVGLDRRSGGGADGLDVGKVPVGLEHRNAADRLAVAGRVLNGMGVGMQMQLSRDGPGQLTVRAGRGG
jgi:hypothetical protein